MADPDLRSKKCVPCEAGTPRVRDEQARQLLSQLQGWTIDAEETSIHRAFKFRNYFETMAFVNAVAWIAHGEDHHPDMEVSWGQCTVRWSTHSNHGLSENDFICAAKVDALLPA
jgi:4a-hydroxytetrahydrobiopterin dehydratase